MKKHTLLFAALIFLFACNSNETNTSETIDKEKSEVNETVVEDIQTVNFIVEGMTCGGCENSIKKSVNKEDGIIEVSASHTEKNTIVKFDASKISKEQIENLIIDTGYKVLGENTEVEDQADTPSEK